MRVDEIDKYETYSYLFLFLCAISLFIKRFTFVIYLGFLSLLIGLVFELLISTQFGQPKTAQKQIIRILGLILLFLAVIFKKG